MEITPRRPAPAAPILWSILAGVAIGQVLWLAAEMLFRIGPLGCA